MPREREWNQYVEAHTSVCLRSHMRVSAWPGEAKHASFHAKGVDKGGRLLSPLFSLLLLLEGPTLEAAHACAPAYVRGIRWYRMLLEFLFLLASEEQAVCSNIARNYCRRPFPDPEKERKEGVG